MKASETEDDYFGVTVSDPYRILENDSSKITIEWLKAENKLTDNYINKLDYRDSIRSELARFSKQPAYWLPHKKAGKYFYYYQDSTFRKRVFCYSEQPNTALKVLVNPLVLFKDENIQIAGGIRVSEDGKFLAFKTSQGGEDWNTIYVMNIETGELLPDKIENVKFSDISWAEDGFYYCRYDNFKKKENTQLTNHKVYYHKVGTLTSQDKLIFQNSEEKYNTFLTQIMPEGKYLFIYEEDINGNERIYYKDLDPADNQIKKIVDFDDYNYHVSGIMDDKILIRTNRHAPNNKLIAIDAKNPDMNNFSTIIKGKDNLLRSVSLAGGKIIALYMVDVCADIHVMDKNGSQIKSIPLPSKGWSDGIVSSNNDDEVLFSFSSYTYPYINYRYDISTNEIEILNFDSPSSFNPEQFITEQVFFHGERQHINSYVYYQQKGYCSKQ